MNTFWVLGKGISPSQLVGGPVQAGVPQAQTPSLQRQTSHHSSLAAVVFGMMQASKRTTINTTREYFFDRINSEMCVLSYNTATYHITKSLN